MPHKALKIGTKKITFSLFGILFFYILLYALFPFLISNNVTEYVKDLGVFGPVILILFEFFSRIVPPVSGAPGVILGMANYGVKVTCLIIYTGSLLGACFNFFLAKRFGKKLIEKIFRKKYSTKFYSYINRRAVVFLLFGVIIGFSFLDILAYLIGLTKMTFRKFFMLYALSSLIPVLATFFIFKNSDMRDINTLTIWFIYVSILSVIFGVWFEIQEHKCSGKI